MNSCIIVGAGISGLLAGQALVMAGWQVTLLDKGFRPGGRIATRRVGDAVFDHGAQFFTVRDPEFGAIAGEWMAQGLAGEWSRGFDAGGDGHPRYRALRGMNAIPAALAKSLPVRSQFRVCATEAAPGGWTVRSSSGEVVSAYALILTPPVPQSLALLDAGGVHLPASPRDALESIQYARCIAAMVQLRGPSGWIGPGAVRPVEGPIAWMADNQRKGISPRASGITIHATPEFSETHWDAPDAEVTPVLLAELGRFTTAEPASFLLHRWRYSQPLTVHPDRSLHIAGHAPLVFAGDAFGGPRVEGAALSGLAAARLLMQQ